MATLKWTTGMLNSQCESCCSDHPQADTVHTQQIEIDPTREPLQPTNAMPSNADRDGDIQNTKDRWLARSTAKIMPAEG